VNVGISVPPPGTQDLVGTVPVTVTAQTQGNLSRVELFIASGAGAVGGALVATLPAVASQVWSWDTTKVVNGIYTLRAEAVYKSQRATKQITVTVNNSSSPPPTGTMVPSSIASAGTADVTAALLAFFATVPDYTLITFQPGGVYRVDGTLQLTGRKGLTFDLNGATVDGSRVVGAGDRAHWRAVDCMSMAWRNGTVKGSRPAMTAFTAGLQWQHGFDMQGVLGYDLAAIIIQGVYGDGVCNGRSPSSLAWTKTGRIHADCQIKGTSRNSISFPAADGVTVDGLQITDMGLNIFSIEASGMGWGATNILIDGARISGTNQAQTFKLLNVADTAGPGAVVKGITVRNTVQVGNSVVAVVAAPSLS
jgi:hypothetical protein